MIDFIGSGIDACDLAGLIPALEKIQHAVGRLVVVDKKGRDAFALDYQSLRRGWFHGRHYSFPRGDRERLLFDTIDGRVDVRFGRSVKNMHNTPGEVVVLLDDDTVLHSMCSSARTGCGPTSGVARSGPTRRAGVRSGFTPLRSRLPGYRRSSVTTTSTRSRCRGDR